MKLIFYNYSSRLSPSLPRSMATVTNLLQKRQI